MIRLHGYEAIRRVELYGGQLRMYGEHQAGGFAGLEDQIVEIEDPEEDFARLRSLAAQKPYLIYVDIEEDAADASKA